MLRQHLALASAFLLALILGLGGATADDLPAPEGDIVLTVTGAIVVTNKDGAAVFDMDMLKALPATTFKTSTIWTDGVNEYTGVALDDFLAAVGAKGDTVHAIALNDYAVDIPASDAVKGGPIIAYEMDGEVMSVRDKGPLWIIYPFDSSTDYRKETIYARAIWQLDRLKIE